MALAAARGDKSLAELASQHAVYPNQISAWNKQLLEGMPELFEGGRKRMPIDESAEASRLYEEIRRLKVELDWLKKSLPSSTAARRAWIDWDEPRVFGSTVKMDILMSMSTSAIAIR